MNFETRTPGWAASFFDNCTGFFYVHYTTHETNGFTSHPKDEAMVKCLADTGVTTGTRTRGLERNFAVQVLLLMLLILSPKFHNNICFGCSYSSQEARYRHRLHYIFTDGAGAEMYGDASTQGEEQCQPGRRYAEVPSADDYYSR